MSAVVLMYHMIDRPQTQADARFRRTPAQFRADMRQLADQGYSARPRSAQT